MAACYIISRSVGRISRTQPVAATHRHHQHTGHEWLSDTAVRPKILETPLGGLDKMYRLHKWLGIIALSGSILHWTCKQFPKWLIELGLIDGKRPPRPPMQEILTLKDWLATQRHFAEEVGEIAFMLPSSCLSPPSSNVYPTAGLPNSTYLSSPFISRSCGTPSYWQILPIGRNRWDGCSSQPYLQASPAR